MRKEVAEMTVDERRLSIDTEDEESSSVSPIKNLNSIHIKENSPFIYPSSTITDVSYLNSLLLIKHFPYKIYLNSLIYRLMKWKATYMAI